MAALDLPDQTEILVHQTAGHMHKHGKIYTGMLKHLDGFVMKTVQNNERGKREIEFYEQVVHSTSPIICQLRNLIPRFLGLHQFISDGSVHYYIKMEDVAANFSKPCVADIKIGRQTWDPYSTPEKQLSEDNKYRGTKDHFGFCIPGMCIYDIASGQVLKLDKKYGRTLDSVSVRDALLLYLNGTNGVNRLLLSDILHQLHTIRRWFEEQRHFTFYATSLLFVYDADLLEKNASPNVRIRMIDFAHVYPAHGSQDANYIHGLCNLIQLFEDFL